MTDLFNVTGDFTTAAYKDFREYFYAKAVTAKPNGYFKILLLSVKKYVLVGGMFFFFVNIIQVLTPVFIKLFLDWLQNPLAEDWKGFVYATVLTCVLITRAFLSQNAMQLLHSGAIVINNYIGCLIAEKISNLPPGARKYISTAKITNFLTSDIRSVQGCAMTIHQMVITPVLIIIYTVMIIYATKWVGLFVPLILIICVPIQVKINKLFMMQTKGRMILADQRAKLVSQIITGVKNIKFNAWE